MRSRPLPPGLARDRRGFSLLEMMVVLVVFGIAMLVAIPNLQRANQTHQLNQSVSTIEASMRRARSIAATKRIPVQVTVDVNNRECRIAADNDDDGTFEQTVATSELNQDVIVSEMNFGGGNTVVFDERGAPDNPGNVVLRTRDGDGRELLVSAGSGSVMVMKAPELSYP